jgi:asparagine synthase (glutamine-hydrolysing)
VPLYFVAALARRHVTVVLTGEGSDELLAGYGRYPRIAWNWYAGTIYEHMLPRAVRAFVAERLVPRAPKPFSRYVKRTFLAMDRTPESMFYDNFASVRLKDQRELLSVDRRAAATTANAYAASASFFRQLNGHTTFLDRLLYADIKTYLVELLMKQDQMSMASSIESRVPFLDHTFVEFSARVPARLKIRNGSGKYIVKKAVEDLLPLDIIYRKKMGFPTPLRAWLMDPKAEPLFGLLRDPDGLLASLVDRSALDHLLTRHQRGFIDATDRIWRLLNLQVWGGLFFTGRRNRHDSLLTKAKAHSAL